MAQRYVKPNRRVMDIAWLRDGDSIHTGEAMMLACLLHTKGKGRKSEDFKDVQRILHDPNLD